MNKIIGFDAEKKNESDISTSYSWELNKDSSIDANISKSDGTATIRIWYRTKDVTKRTDFSNWDEIKKRLNSSEGLYYDDFVKLMGGVEGVLTEKSSSSLTYKWYNKEDGYLFAYFDAKTKKCTLASGRF